MKHRQLGAQGFSVSEIGLGCWQLGADWGAAVAEDTARSILEAASENGVQFFDTADVYGDGRSERLIGAFLKTLTGPAPRIATKFGRAAHVYPNGYSKENMRAGIEGSLERLGVDQLDLVQLHCIPTEELRKGDVFDWLREFKAEGLIAHFGASVETVEEGLIAIKQDGILSLQVIFNIFRQKVSRELLPVAEQAGVGIIVRLPLASGLLSGKFKKDTVFDAGDHRNFNRDGQMFNVGETFAGVPFDVGVDLVEELKSFAPDGFSMADLANRWILDHSAVSTIIPGASSADQIVRNASASGLSELGAELHATLSAFYDTKIEAHIRGAY